MGLDFTNCKIEPTYLYNGSNGKKIGIVYDDEIYMLKFASFNDKKLNYTNSTISEYISCHILETMGIDAQKTLLGKYKLKNGEEKIAVACKDFTAGGYLLKEFAELKNGVINTSNNGYGTDLEEVLETIEMQNLILPETLKNFFWEMFIADALLGNFDRHNGNWGFLINRETGDIKIAPIFDCGSCLYPQLTDEAMEEYLNTPDEIDKRIFIFPNSALKIEGEKINYYRFITEAKNADCNEALCKIFPKIELDKIYAVIDDTPYISNIRKKFYKEIITKRYQKILEPAYRSLKDTK